MCSVSGIRKLCGALVVLFNVAACASNGALEQRPIDQPQASVAPGKPVFVQKDILKKSASELDAKLGIPALIRKEGAGEFRRYTMVRCALIVVLYPDDTGVMIAEHLDAAAKTSDETRPSLDMCLAGGLAAGETVGV